MVHLPFADRFEAGALLADELSRHGIGTDAVVLALTRGGVPVGSAVAGRLGLILDVLVARKIGVPWEPELAMGAIAGTVQMLDGDMIRELGVSAAEVEEAVKREKAQIERRELLYRAGNPPVDIGGRTAVLVDDGVATGSTMAASVRYARSLNPAKAIVAVPVGSSEACRRLRTEADDVVCLATPEHFQAVGQWYRAFPQVSDCEVRELLTRNRRGARAA